MENLTFIIKGCLIAVLAYIGIQVATTSQDFISVKILYGTPGYYLLIVLPILYLVWFVNVTFRVIRKRFIDFKTKNHEEIKKKCDA